MNKGQGDPNRSNRPYQLPVLSAHARLIFNAAALTIGTGATAGLGFIYWWFAARSFSAEAVGVAAATISIMNFLALLAEFGMGTLLMGQIPKSPESAPALISATLIAALVAGVSIGGLYIAAANWMSVGLGAITEGIAGRAVFVIGLALTGVLLVLDQAFVGMLQSSLQMYRTITFAVIKLLLLIAVAYSAGLSNELSIVTSWLVAQVFSVFVLGVMCRFQRRSIWRVPRFDLLKPLVRTVIQHHALNSAVQAPSLILPFVVAVALSPRINAAFYAAWMLINVVLLVPASMTAVMYSISATDPPHKLPNRLRFSLGLCLSFGLAASVGLLFASDLILGLFNPDYSSIAGKSLELLGFGTLAVMLKYHYVVIQRLRDRMVQASFLLGAGAAVEVGAATIGARYGELNGLTRGWLIAVLVEAVVLGPTVIRAAFAGVKAPNPSSVLIPSGESLLAPLRKGDTGKAVRA